MMKNSEMKNGGTAYAQGGWAGMAQGIMGMVGKMGQGQGQAPQLNASGRPMETSVNAGIQAQGVTEMQTQGPSTSGIMNKPAAQPVQQQGSGVGGLVQGIGNLLKKKEPKPERINSPGTSGGFEKFMNDKGGSATVQKATNALAGGDAGSKIGKGVGTAVGTAFFGPLGGVVGGMVGKFGGDLIDRSDNKIDRENEAFDRNQKRLQGANFGSYMNSKNTAYTQHGGTVEYGSGGDVMPMGGGDVRTASYNPYTDGGETGMITGNSHAEGGVMLNYAGNKIEAQGGEPYIKMQEGGQAENMVIF